MNSAQEWDDVLQCSLMYLSTSALLVLVGGWVTSFLCTTPGVGRPNLSNNSGLGH